MSLFHNSTNNDAPATDETTKPADETNPAVNSGRADEATTPEEAKPANG